MEKERVFAHLCEGHGTVVSDSKIEIEILKLWKGSLEEAKAGKLVGFEGWECFKLTYFFWHHWDLGFTAKLRCFWLGFW